MKDYLEDSVPTFNQKTMTTTKVSSRSKDGGC